MKSVANTGLNPRSSPMGMALLALAGSAAALALAARADFDPIPLTPESFTHDMIVERSAPAPLNTHVSATMDGGTNNTGWVWFEQGYLASVPQFGLPAQGSPFAAPGDATHVYRLAADYATNNALLVYSASPTGSLAFATPSAHTALSVLLTAAGGAVGSLEYTVHYQGGATQAGTLAVNDWFNTTAAEVAWNANGRVNMDNGQVGNLYGTTPKLFYADFFLIDNVTPVTRVDFASTNGNRAVVFGISGLVGTDYAPIDLTGFNRDMIVEKTAPVGGTLQNRVTVTMDGGSSNLVGNVWYEAGFNPAAPATGIPAAGAALVAGNRTFTMPASYAGSNALFLADFREYTAGTLTLATPAAYTGLSFLGAAGNGPLVVSVTVHHEDLSTEVFSVSIPDWFNTAATTVHVANGRVNPVDLTFNNVNNNNPRLHALEIALAGASPVTRIEFARVSGGRGPIFAVSGQTTAGGNYDPVAVTGFNADIVVEASPAWPPAGLQAYTTASMDGGVANTGSTWHERGYYPQFPASGLPAPGTIVTSLDKSDHHYRMPATYAGNNAAFVDSVRSNVNLTLAVPAPYSALSFLSATANNNVTNQVIVQFQDGSSETNVFVSRDWFNNTPFAYTARGRVNVISRTMNNATTDNPRLYEAEFALANNVSPVTNVVLRFLGAVNPATGRMAVLAVSATAGAVRPIIATQPASVLCMEGTNVQLSAVMGGGTEPIDYRWHAGTNGVFAPVANGAVISGATTPTLGFTGIVWTNAADYYMVASNAAGPSTSSVVNITVRSGLADVTQPGDPVAIIAGSTPANEGAPNAINNNTTKYLNFDVDNADPFDPPVGFTVTPSIRGTIVNVLRIYTANDADARDPASFLLEGSLDDGVSWTEIASGPLALPTARNAAGLPLDPLAQALQEVRFANTTPYNSYKLTFNSVRNGAQHMMQVGEVEFLGTVADLTGPPVLRRDVPAKVVVYAGRTLTLSPLFGGTEPIAYAWQKDGGALVDDGRVGGATNDTLTVARVGTGDAGNYQVLASNALGSASSSIAGVTVELLPDFNGDGAGWTLNGGATVAGDVLTLTSGENNQARSVFFDVPLYIGAFRASFTYQDVTGGGADGFAFVAHNAAQGAEALGAGGGLLAYSGIAPSAALMFNIYNSSGIALGTNGTRVGEYAATGAVDLRSANPIDVVVEYVGGQVTVTLTDAVTAGSFTVSLPIDLPAFVGGPTAYVGFTGATGGQNATQTIQNFLYTPLPTVAAGKGGGSEVVLTWPASIGGYALESCSSLSLGDWTAVPEPVTEVNGMNQVTVSDGGTRFYRLVLVP